MAERLPNLEQIQHLAEEKEEQWRSAATVQIKSLQTALTFKSEVCEELELKFSQLKTDFKYNLKLLQERDAELQVMDRIQQALKINESKFLSELSDLHIKINSLKAKVKREEDAKQEMEIHYKQRLIEQQTKLEIFRTSKSKEMEELISDFQKTKLQLEQENSQLKFQVEAQKLDLVNEMELLLKSKEKEQQKIEEENHNQQVFLEMKNKLLSKEMEVCRDAEKEQETALDTAKKRIDVLQAELQKAKWDLTDASSMKNARILELEAKVKHLETTMENVEKEFSERSMHLDKEVRRREANLLASKQTLIDREKRFQKEIRSLESKVEMSKAEVNRALWDKNNVKAELEDGITKYKSELDTLRERLENMEIEKSTNVCAKDTEMALLKKREEILKADNSKLKYDIEKYKNDVVKSAKREEALERNMQQVKLDFKQKCEDAESDAYVKAEDFASNLLKARDSAMSERDRIQMELDGLKRIQNRMDQRLKAALFILKKHDMLSDYEDKLSMNEFSANEFFHSQTELDLLEQNNQLKHIIKEMTAEMKQLNIIKSKTRDPSDNKYVESIETELIELKKDRRRLKEQIQTLQETGRTGVDMDKVTAQSYEVSEHHPKIQQHITALNNKIGGLEAEKVEMRAQLQKVQAKFDHQLIVSQQHEQESNAVSSKLQQLELETTANKHRSEQEIKRLKNEISSMSLQLTESRQEADEYYRGGIQNNMRAMELSDKVSQLTVGMAADTPWLSSHAQAKVIQDLQDQMSQLQKQLAHEKQNKIFSNLSSLGGTTDAINLLQLRLKSAAERIRALMQEKNMLLESSNKMRAELSALKRKQNGPNNGQIISPKKTSSEEGKLEKMEKLQYDLTKKQLAFAQRQVQSSVESSKSLSEDTSKDPPKSPLSHGLRSPATTPSRVPVTDRMMISSIDDSSMKDVWKVLEQEPSSPSIAGDQETKNVPLQKKARKPSVALTKKKKKPQIRNYNIKDDKS